MSTYAITTTLPYVNADPHIGFALEIVQADMLARYHRLLGHDVVFNTGTDEHGLKIHRKAEERGITAQAYCDEYAAKFGELKEALNLSYTNFIRTTDPKHKAAAQEFWNRCAANGDIYKKQYQVKYCVGCELEKTDSELDEQGKCPIHPTYELELIDEENYFFRFSAYQEKLLELYAQDGFVMPAFRSKEIASFVEGGLNDFSISRLKEKMPWGVAVPGDDTQVMYVWFDALVNYISTLDWPTKDIADTPWPGIQVAGKDNLRQQTAMWQAMLLSAGLPPSKQIFIHGFITSEGQKMSKSIGNVVAPYDVVKQYGTDAVRFFLLGGLPAYEDGDWSTERFEAYYTAHLANGIGNLTSRTIAMLAKYTEGTVPPQASDVFDTERFWEKYDQAIAQYRFDEVIRLVNELVAASDSYISAEEPWAKAKAGEPIGDILYRIVEVLRHIAFALLPIIPHAAEKIFAQLGIDPTDTEVCAQRTQWGGMPESGIVTKADGVLFARLNA
jgi:methionyl-tRNA synthetase